MIKCLICKILKKYSKQEDQKWIPQISNDEIFSIKQESAKFIYDNAIGILLNIDKSINDIINKADVIFKYLFTIQGAVLVSFIAKKEFFIINKWNMGFFIFFLLLPNVIYLYGLISPQAIKGTHNSPENTITKRALQNMNIFYILESIEIQQYAIPFNNNNLQKRAKALKYLIITALMFIIYSFCLFGFYTII